MEKDLKQLEPKDRLKMIIDLSSFILPKMKQTDMNIETDKNFNPVTISFEDVEADFDTIFNNLDSRKSDIVRVIKKYVPDFEHIETGKHLDQKM